MEQGTKKIPFYKRVIMGIKDVDQYQEFAVEKVSKGVSYFLKLMLLFSVLVAIGFTYQFSRVIGSGVSYIQKDMPEFHYENGMLNVDADGPLVFEQVKGFSGMIIIDTKVEEQKAIDEYTKKMSAYDNGILLLKDRMIIKNMATSMQGSKMYTDIASKYQIESFTKQEAVQVLSNPKVYVAVYVSMCIVWIIYLFILYFLSGLIDALVAGVLGYLIARIVGMKLRFKSVYNMAIYSLTLPILLNAIYMIVNLFTGFTIAYFQIMYTSISFIYMVAAILIIRSDLIKRQTELMKIAQEQERVKEELAAQKQKEKEEEEKKQVDKPKKKKEPKEKEDNQEKEQTKPVAKPKKKKASDSGEDTNIGKEAKGEI